MSPPSAAGPRARPTDIRVLEAEVSFVDVELDPPFVISGRPMTHLTSPQVRLTVETRAGLPVDGHGAGMLSVPWSWPHSSLEIDGREQVMRRMVRSIGTLLGRNAEAGDPFTLWRPLYEALDPLLGMAARDDAREPVPRLAGLLALGAWDNALHDAWSRAAERSPYEMYSGEYMNQDLGWVMPGLADVHPGDHLGPRRGSMPVQHALGVGDPLVEPGPDAGKRPIALEHWIRREGISHLKLKLGGHPVVDAQRVADAYELIGRAEGSTLSLDPNEAYTPELLAQMLDELDLRAPSAARSITYLEQPFPRDLVVEPARMERLARRLPVLMDEGYTNLDQLAGMSEHGWSGVVIKAAKGQSHAMITLAAARARGLRVAIQDLTTVGPALEHSLGLGAEIGADWAPIEYNSRQYAAGANADLAERRPELVTVRDGRVRVDRVEVGLYST